jgi:hypothetical protein
MFDRVQYKQEPHTINDEDTSTTQVNMLDTLVHQINAAAAAQQDN